MPMPHKGFCFVTYADNAAAMKALEHGGAGVQVVNSNYPEIPERLRPERRSHEASFQALAAA
jgi:hypothetical protein